MSETVMVESPFRGRTGTVASYVPGSRIELLRGLERTLADCRSGVREFVSATQVSLSPGQRFHP